MKLKLYRHSHTPELEAFVNRMELNEPFDYTAHFIFVGKINGELAFVNVYRLEVVDGKVVPRFIHILLDEPIRRSKLAVDLLNQAEDYLRLLGYTETFAYILNGNRVMGILAQKYGYKVTKEDNQAKYYLKNLTKET